MIQAFDSIKKITAEEVSLTFPDPVPPRGIFTDAFDTQLGAATAQAANGKCVATAFFSRKLPAPQLSHATLLKEMLCVVKILKEHQPILWGAKICIHTGYTLVTLT